MTLEPTQGEWRCAGCGGARPPRPPQARRSRIGPPAPAPASAGLAPVAAIIATLPSRERGVLEELAERAGTPSAVDAGALLTTLPATLLAAIPPEPPERPA